MLTTITRSLSSLLFLPPPHILSLPTLFLHQPRLPKTTFPCFPQLPLAATTSRSSSIKSLPATTSRFTNDADDAGVLAVGFPGLAYACTLYFKSGFNVQVDVDEDETEDSLIMRFNRSVRKARVLRECRRRRFFESTQDKRIRKTRDAARRNRNRRPQSRVASKEEAPKNHYDLEDDNWELPEGDIPYCQHIHEEKEVKV